MARAGAWLLPGTLAGVAIGIAAADAGRLGAALLLGGAGIAVVLAVSAGRPTWRRGALAAGLACLIGVGAGGLRMGLDVPSEAANGSEMLPVGDPLQLAGTVADEPTPRGDAVDVVLADLRTPQGPLGGRVLLRVPRSVAVTAGDEVAAEVTLREPDQADADEVAYRERLRRQGIGAVGRAFEVQVVGRHDTPVVDALGGLRRWLLDGLLTTVPEPEASLGAGILLGIRAGIDPAIRDAFAVAGLSHVVAISGWNVAIVVALIVAATRRLRTRLGPVAPVCFAVIAMVGYVILVGASPAVVRAALMAAALLASRLGGAAAHAASALMAAVLVMLLVSPTVLWDVGFQLSALATGGLIVLGAPLERRLGRWPGWVRTPLALTVAAQLATLPVLLATFGQVSLVAPLANVAVVPLVPAVMAGAAAAAVVGGLADLAPVPLLADGAAWLAGGAAWLPLRALVLTGSAAAEFPLASLPVAGSAWFTVAWYPLLGLAVRRLSRPAPDAPPVAIPLEDPPTGPHLALPEAAAFTALATWVRPRRVAAAVLLVVATATMLTGPDGRLHVTVLDIGQGDAILVETPDGRTALIDGGVDPDLTLRRIGQALPFHQRRIDLVILTHPHQDHLGGLEEVLRRYEVGAFGDGGRPTDGDPERRLRAAALAEPGLAVVPARAGRVITLGGGVELEILFPSATDVAAPLPEDDVNNASVVILLRYGRFEALLTGDAEAAVEALLLDRGMLQRVEVLKVGHHGSDSSTTPAFLDAVQPAVALISLGADNSYGHPHRSTLEALADVPELEVFRTDLDGSIEVISDGASFTVVGVARAVGPIPATD